MKKVKHPDNLLIIFPEALRETIDETREEIKARVGREIPRTEFIRGASECIAKIGAEHLSTLIQRAEKQGYLPFYYLSKVIQEAVETYLSQKQGQESKSGRSKGRKSKQ